MAHLKLIRFKKIWPIAAIFLIFFIRDGFGQKTVVTMEEAISRALVKNNQVRSSYFAMKKANWDKRNAYSMLFPVINFNTRFTWIDDETFALRDFSRYFRDTPSIPGLPKFDIPQIVFQESYVSTFDLTMPIFNGAVLNGISIARANEEMATHLNESTRNSIIFQVISTYLNVLKTKEILQLQRDYLELSRLNFEKAERLYNAGRYSRTEALRWKVDYQQQKGIVVNNESALRSNLTVLGRLINVSSDELIDVDVKISQPLLVESEKLARKSDDEILAMIRLNEVELVKANDALAAAKASEKAGKRLYRASLASYLPNLTLSYSYGWRENATLAFDDYSPKTLMLNFNVPIFTGFQNYSAAKSAYYDYKRGQEDYYDQLQNTRYILNETVNKIINLKTQRELSLANVEYNEANYRVVEKQKEKGLVSNIDFIDAKLNLQDAKLNDVSVHYDFISAMVELYYLLGKLKTVM